MDAIAKIDDVICQKNKSDGFTRLITVIQAEWFALQFIRLLSQGLSIATLGLATLGLIACTLPTPFLLDKKTCRYTVTGPPVCH